MYAICGKLQVRSHRFTLEAGVAKHFFFVGWLFSLLGRAGQGSHGAHGDTSIDVECLVGDVSAGLIGASENRMGQKNGWEEAGWEEAGWGRRASGNVTADERRSSPKKKAPVMGAFFVKK
jgi:hypothetical protein